MSKNFSLHSFASTPSEAIVYISIEYWRLLQSINFHKICLQFTKVQKEMLSRIIWRHCLEHISSVYLSIHTVWKSQIMSENSIFKNEKNIVNWNFQNKNRQQFQIFVDIAKKLPPFLARKFKFSRYSQKIANLNFRAKN